MAYDDFSQFPKGRTRYTDVDTTAQTIFTGPGRVAGIHIRGGAAAEIVIFRAVDDSPVYFQHDIAATPASTYIPVSFFAEDGLEVLTASAAGDVEVTVFYWHPNSTVA